MTSSRFTPHRLGLSALKLGPTRRTALRVAAIRGRAIALVYHRVTPAGAGPNDIPPNVSVALFREHLEALSEVGDIVPLSDLLKEPRTRRRVRIAVTFDDDDQCHVDHALPVLLALGVRATFFLNGRLLHGLGAYWWMLLEHVIEKNGIDSARRILGVAGDNSVSLAARCEGTTLTDRLSKVGLPADSLLLGEVGIRTLANAGMQIGFHTLHHPVLTTLSDAPLDEELRYGRERLSEAAGAPVDVFAYPHGRANSYVAERVRAAGYRAAFRMGGRSITADSDRFMLGRLGTATLSADELVALVALQLSKAATPAESL